MVLYKMSDEREPLYELKIVLAMCVRFNFFKLSIYVINISTTYLNIILSFLLSILLEWGFNVWKQNYGKKISKKEF